LGWLNGVDLAGGGEFLMVLMRILQTIARRGARELVQFPVFICQISDKKAWMTTSSKSKLTMVCVGLQRSAFAD
jgi:hypothetical protein